MSVDTFGGTSELAVCQALPKSPTSICGNLVTYFCGCLGSGRNLCAILPKHSVKAAGDLFRVTGRRAVRPCEGSAATGDYYARGCELVLALIASRSMSASTMIRASSGVWTLASQPNSSLARVGSPMRSSTSVGRR